MPPRRLIMCDETLVMLHILLSLVARAAGCRCCYLACCCHHHYLLLRTHGGELDGPLNLKRSYRMLHLSEVEGFSSCEAYHTMAARHLLVSVRSVCLSFFHRHGSSYPRALPESLSVFRLPYSACSHLFFFRSCFPKAPLFLSFLHSSGLSTSSITLSKSSTGTTGECSCSWGKDGARDAAAWC